MAERGAALRRGSRATAPGAEAAAGRRVPWKRRDGAASAAVRAGASWAVAAAGALALVACAGEAPPPARHLLLVSIDTLRADALGVYGSERGATPALDALAASGVRFERAYSHSPKTAPSHHALLTSLHPRVHGVGNFETAGATTLPPTATTLAETLRARGFSTGAFTGGGNVKAELGFDRGFDVYDDALSRIDMKLALARRWLKQRSGERWFLFFHTYHVHDPYLVPEDVLRRFADPAYDGRIIGTSDALREALAAGGDLRAPGSTEDVVVANFWARVDESDPRDVRHLADLYTAGVADMDRHLGRFLEQVGGLGLLDDALVVITSDHGEEFGEHGRVRHDQLWREVLHVPLLVRHPAGRGAGLVIDAPVEHVDFVPSVLELLDVADTTSLRQGRSWAKWLDDPSRAPRDAVQFAEHRATKSANLDVWSVRKGGWLLLHDEHGEHLRDLVADPAELVPVDDPARSAALRQEALRLIGRLTQEAARVGPSPGIELDAATRAELAALGYL